ncbi:MAG: hypothetical protein IJ966_07855 [Bacilli bacterium]|nr:hypothetical protein [Bacilli bacterium]
MNINKIKNSIKDLVGFKLKIKVYKGRNKYEYFDGFIDKIYDNIFTIKTLNGIKSFSYSDVVTKVVVITKFN